MRVIVTGSRGWDDRARIANRLKALPDGSVVVVGYNPEKDTPAGADRITYQEAHKLGLEVETHPAQWKSYGKGAGIMRNEEMAVLGADLCIAFWDGSSSGTQDMMQRAEDHGISVETHKAFL